MVDCNGTIQHSANTEYKEDGEVLVKTGAITQKDKDGKDVVIPTNIREKDGQAENMLSKIQRLSRKMLSM